MVQLENKYKKIISECMSEKRYIHSVNVAKKAVELAKIYGANEEKAAIAGIVHDITKEMANDEQLDIIKSSGAELDAVEKVTKKLWHSISGAIYIRQTLGIEDEDIINAVRYHTTGRSGMSLLEKVIFVADFISDERDYEGVEYMKKAVKEGLEEAVFCGSKFSIKSLLKSDLCVHHNTVMAYNGAKFIVRTKIR